jgi:DNA replication protein DnaC
MMNNKSIYWQEALVSRIDREKQNQHNSVVLWFTGLSGGGKSTLAHALGAAAVPLYLMVIMSVMVFVLIWDSQNKIVLRISAELEKWLSSL